MLLELRDRGENVEHLQSFLDEAGFEPQGVDGIFGKNTAAALVGFQTEQRLPPSGAVDVATLDALHEFALEVMRHARREAIMLARDLAPPSTAPIPVLEDTLPPGSDFDLSPAVAWADQEWCQSVHEPPGFNWERIDSYIRGKQGLVWTWEDLYDQNGEFAWCGAFAARALAEVGLRKDLRVHSLASTYRIVAWAKGTDRLLSDPRQAQPGDIVIVGHKGKGKKWYGNHVTLCRGVDGDDVLTFEGNAKGPGPDGSRYEGVIRKTRPFEKKGQSSRVYRVMHVVRVKAEDCA